MKYLYGVTSAMITPFNQDNSVNLEKVAKHTEFLISKGIDCLYPLGTTGEMLKLSLQERKEIAEVVVKIANRRVTVYIHVGDAEVDNVIELAKHAHQIGADGIGVVTPIYHGVNNREMEEFYVQVAKSVPADFPVYLYNIPQTASNDLSAKVAERISQRCHNVVGIKYSYPDMLQTEDYLNIGEHESDFQIMFGPDRLFLPALAMGCAGTISGVSCVYPEPFVAIYKAYQENDMDKARRFQKIASKYVKALKGGSNMSYFKEALKMRGIDVGYMKTPQLDIQEEEIAILKDDLTKIDKEFNSLLAQY